MMPAQHEERMSGTVARLIQSKGFGFIRADTGVELFLHMSNCLPGVWEQLAEGTAVTFVATSTAKGSRAVLVRLA